MKIDTQLDQDVIKVITETLETELKKFITSLTSSKGTVMKKATKKNTKKNIKKQPKSGTVSKKTKKAPVKKASKALTVKRVKEQETFVPEIEATTATTLSPVQAVINDDGAVVIQPTIDEAPLNTEAFTPKAVVDATGVVVMQPVEDNQ